MPSNPETDNGSTPTTEEVFFAVRDEFFPDEGDWEFFVEQQDLNLEEALTYVSMVLIDRGFEDPAGYLIEKDILQTPSS